MFTLIFIVTFVSANANGSQSSNSVLTQSGFPTMEQCNAAGAEMVKRNALYNQNSKVEWVCK